jgi:transcriptional regulator with XRE-family HTH domain
VKCPYCNGTGELADPFVGALILAQRKALNLTQEQLSERVGLSRAQIANVENGRSDMPLKTLQRFAKALECSMKDLVP